MHLTEEQIQTFKQRLVHLKSGITKQLMGASGEVRRPDEATGYTQHQADQGTDDFDRNITLEVTSSEFSLLKRIDRALEKIEENTYGLCDITQEPIPIKRLEAVPYATMTVKAQEMLEKGQI